jgi:hypothetical protein
MNYISPLENRLIRRLEAQRDGVLSAIAATKASQLLLDEALSGNAAAELALVYAAMHQAFEPAEPPWAIANVSVTHRINDTVHLPPSKLFYKMKQMKTDKPIFRENDFDGESERSFEVPRLIVEAWTVDALCLGIIREVYSGRPYIDDNAFVDFTIAPPEGTLIPESPEEWEREFMKVHARYCPTLSLSLAIPATIIRHGRKATYSHIVNLVTIEKGVSHVRH